MKYPKIKTLWKRDEKKWNIIPGDYSCEEFKNVQKWHVTEKVDGTNIRIMWNGTSVIFGGRTDNAQIPCYLLENLQKIFTVDKIQSVFGDSDVILFGEGYGPKIQKGGGLYCKDPSFILFDVFIGNWWIKQEDLQGIADDLGIKRVPIVGIMTEKEIEEYVKNSPESICAEQKRESEGVMCRSEPLMLFRNKRPIMFKLKVKDYEKTR